MKGTARELRLQVSAQRAGLKIVLDRYSWAATGKKQYLLRPIWDARRALRVLPDGGTELVTIPAGGRRLEASRLPLDAIERVVHSWTIPKPTPSVPAW